MYDIAIIGAGACGATLAYEFARRGKRVVLLEKGEAPEKTATFWTAMKWYDRSPLLSRPFRSKEGVIIWRVFVDGGGTTVCCANGIRSLEKEFLEYGVSLEAEFTEAERELCISPISERLLSEGSRRIRSAAESLGIRMQPMPKFIDTAKCTRCGLCTYGCKYGAKWSATAYLDMAIKNGADILHNFHVRKIFIKNGKAHGVKGHGPNGTVEISANTIIVSAGGIGTPVILQHSGIQSAGKKLFLDLFVTTYGTMQGCNLTHEPPMALVNRDFHAERGFILSPFVNQSRLARLVECGPRGFLPDRRNLVGIMTKIRDDEKGEVYSNGSVSKAVTSSDWEKLHQGISLSKKILCSMGISEKNVFVSRVQGAHPGGTAALGEVVDQNLQTEVKNLYVCDASVLPHSPGLPPILTLVALAKKLGKSVGL